MFLSFLLEVLSHSEVSVGRTVFVGLISGKDEPWDVPPFIFSACNFGVPALCT